MMQEKFDFQSFFFVIKSDSHVQDFKIPTWKWALFIYSFIYLFLQM